MSRPTLWLPSGPSAGDGMTPLDWRRIALTGIEGISFTLRLTEPANRAALARRGIVKAAGWPEAREVAASLG
ncbi:hypothetical protein [Paracoccus sp. (in: a-proteobacteria)]|uniref:hypothetical protein n=1 Tax=Paracoccus sp. TaxID=267 RepID=UPI0026DEA32B|nr:hypothetical protein [Paracoccus sp. (in: a-proteobacteria)]MDO5368985.1 hypothetical protein [Paracoccus sp. (in: a-proteobacteria)]